MSKRHKTSHSAQADENGRVYVYCESCKWSELVDVSGLAYMEAIMAIFRARDAHEADPKGKAPAAPSPTAPAAEGPGLR